MAFRIDFHSVCHFMNSNNSFCSGQWRVFSGNELGALLGWWMFQCWKQQKVEGKASIKDVYMLSSTVSSKILRAIAVKEGFHFEVPLLFTPIMCNMRDSSVLWPLYHSGSQPFNSKTIFKAKQTYGISLMFFNQTSRPPWKFG